MKDKSKTCIGPCLVRAKGVYNRDWLIMHGLGINQISQHLKEASGNSFPYQPGSFEMKLGLCKLTSTVFCSCYSFAQTMSNRFFRERYWSSIAAPRFFGASGCQASLSALSIRPSLRYRLFRSMERQFWSEYSVVTRPICFAGGRLGLSGIGPTQICPVRSHCQDVTPRTAW